MPTIHDVVQEKEPGWFKAGWTAVFTLRAMDVLWYQVCDVLSGALILPMVVFSPWAFGTAERWSIHTMTAAGMALGVLLLIKLYIRLGKGFPARRWDQYSARSGTLSPRRQRAARLLLGGLAMLTVAVLAECLISAWNVTANYKAATRTFEYYHYLAWLPHSLDGTRTWSSLWMYLGLAGAFWGVRDWLAGMTAAEERLLPGGGRNTVEKAPRFPGRLGMLLWVLCLSGALMGVEAIVQRVSGTNRLLFLVVPTVHIQGETQFGPYAYRSNAAQYFNMLWPVCLGFWLTLQRTSRRGSRAHHLLLPCAAIMAACPIISTSRAGALVSVGMLVLALVYLGLASLAPAAPVEHLKNSKFKIQNSGKPEASTSPGLPMEEPAPSHTEPGTRSKVQADPAHPAHAGEGGRGTAAWLMLFVVVALGLGWYYGWDTLFPRMQEIGVGYDSREEIFASALPMTKDYPLFGTGPGTFGSVFQLYRFSDEVFWPEQLHDDWLETRITFGWLGLGLVLAALACVWLRWFLPGGMRVNRRLVVLAWLSLAGCLLTARFDFPFQLHSTLFLFLVICAMLVNLSRSSGSSRG